MLGSGFWSVDRQFGVNQEKIETFLGAQKTFWRFSGDILGHSGYSEDIIGRGPFYSSTIYVLTDMV